MDQNKHEVVRLARDDVDDIVSVLCDSFVDYPVMRFVIEPGAGYAVHLRMLMSFFTKARIIRKENMLGVRGRDGLLGVALISFPDAPAPPALDAIREETWRALGAAAKVRYETFGATAARFARADYHHHLNVLGVKRGAQGEGVARALLDAVHACSASDTSSAGVTLSTESERNVPMYEHCGYRVTGKARVGSAFTTWAMFRPD